MKKDKIIIILSCLFLGFMLGLYGSRLFYFYNLENKKETKATTIVDYIKNDSKSRVYYKNKEKNNYVYFSGLMYRILYADKGSIALITDEPVTLLKYGETSNYNSSDIKKWLEDIFLNNLNKEYLSENKVTLLDRNTYLKIGGKKSFVVKDDFWLKDGLIVTEKGELNKTDDTLKFLNVKPVIKLKNFTINGEGTKENPYLVETKKASNLKEAYVGQYIKYNNMLLRIIDKGNNGLTVVAPKLDEKHIFSEKRNGYNKTYLKDIGYYLNTKFINKLNKKDLLYSNYYIGSYETSYKDTYKENVYAYIGLIKVGDYFIGDLKESYTLTKKDDIIYVVDKNGMLYQDETNKKLNIYPVFDIKNLDISGGNGYKKNPYIVGEKNE